MDVLAKRLKTLRSEHGMTQDALAKRLHIARTTLAHYETGAREPRLKTLVDISDVFDVSIDYLLKE